MRFLPRARGAAALLLVAVPTATAATSAAPVAGSWRSLPTAPVRIDAALTSAWTGKELVVFGRRSDLEHPRIVHGTPVLDERCRRVRPGREALATARSAARSRRSRRRD